MLTKITFNSMYLGEDILELDYNTREEVMEAYYTWWAKYNKDEEYADSQLIRIEETEHDKD